MKFKNVIDVDLKSLAFILNLIINVSNLYKLHRRKNASENFRKLNSHERYIRNSIWEAYCLYSNKLFKSKLNS